ncbi:S41 family peptidase [Candidatus Dependentiae bacterium]|nr:MAG: S41 family peptidase [Candidatus Dependentiae bacterium]
MKLPIPHPKNKNIIPIILLLAGFIVLPLVSKQEITDKPDQKKLQDFDEIVYNWSRTLAETLQTIKKKHYNPYDKLQQGMVKAIDALLNELDPHSSCLGPKEYQNILESTSGAFFGIGVVIDNTRNKKDKSLTIVETLPDGPAHKVGTKAMDKIVEIDGQPLEGMSTEEAMAKLKGKQKTKVQIKVLRGNKNELLTFDITRDIIKERNLLCFYLEDQNIYYISLNIFSEQAINQIRKLLQESHKKNYKGLIMDLRNNSGGLLTSAINIAGLFLPKDSLIVTTRDKNNKELEQYITKQPPVRTNQISPIFILINNYTASASEILAGCLKTYSEKNSENNQLMVFLIGTKTFGKGSVQEIIPISNNCALKVTTSLYYLPDNTPIQGTGIEPDFIVEKVAELPEQVAWFKKHYGSEKSLSNYIKPIGYKEPIKKEKIKKDDIEKSWIERCKEMLTTDNQFCAAVHLINILYNIRQTNPKQIVTSNQARTFLKSIYPIDKKIVMTEVKVEQ